MAFSSQSGFYISALDEITLGAKSKGDYKFCPPLNSSQYKDSNSGAFPVLSCDFLGKPIVVSDQKGFENWKVKTPSNFSVHVCKVFFFPFLYFGFWLLAFVDFCISILHYSFGLQQIIVNIWFQAQASICVSRAMKWWEKTLHPNMVEIHSAQELVDSLKNAGDRLVVVDFYSPGCGGCRALHPKVYSIFSLCSRDQITNSYISV